MSSTSTGTAAPPWPDVPGPSSPAPERLSWCAAVATRAPSKHNSQPWRFVVHELPGRGWVLDVWGDPARALPDTDPHRRELALSVGAAVHLAGLAVRVAGHEPVIELLPDGQAGPLARVTEAAPRAVTAREPELLAAAASRRTDRGPLDGQALPPATPFLLQDAAAEQGAVLRLVTSPGDRATLAALVARADGVLARSGQVDRELGRWLREPGPARGDGVPVDHTRGVRESYRAEFVQRDFSRAGSAPAPHRDRPDRPLLGVLCTPTDTPRDWLRAGQALAAVLLEVTAVGGAASYLNQPVEEPTARQQLREQLALPGTAQLVLRLGAGSDVAPTPRRDLHEVLYRTGAG